MRSEVVDLFGSPSVRYRIFDKIGAESEFLMLAGLGLRVSSPVLFLDRKVQFALLLCL